MKRALALIALLLLLPALVRLLHAQGPSPSQASPPPPSFTLTDLGPVQNIGPPGGATAVNSSAQVVGTILDPTASYQNAFLWQNGTRTDLGTFPGGNISYGYGINNSGQIAGAAQLSAASAGATFRAVIWQNGVITSLDNSAANSGFYSYAFGINTAGDVVGFTNTINGVDEPVIWKGGTASGLFPLTPLPGPLTPQGRALAINDAGQAAGYSLGADVAPHPVMWDATGNVTDLGTFGAATANLATAINNSGIVVGYSQLPVSSGIAAHAFLWQSGTMQDLGTVPGTNLGGTTDTSSSAWGINSNGDIVGISSAGMSAAISGTGGRAFFYTAGTMYDLTSLLAPGSGTGWQLENAYAINDNRQIVGVGVAPDHTEHGYLLSPALAPTTTTASAFPSSSVFGQQVSFTVNVIPNASSALTPSGSVTINDGATAIGTVALASGTGTFNTSALSVGSHSITAVYAGDSNFAASTSSPTTLTVDQGATASSVSAFPNPGTVGQVVTLSATVTAMAPAAGTPTGTVTFLDGATSLGTGTLSGGQATLATSSLTSGSHSITVTYAGDANFLGSASSAVSLRIQQATTTTLIVAPNPAAVGQLVTLSATVIANSGTPSGETVTFLDGATVLGTGTISPGGAATFTTTSLAAGNHSLSASYPGDANFMASTSGPVLLTVTMVLPPVIITDNESITVTDSVSFPDVADSESIHVADQISVQLISPTTTSISAPGVTFGTPAAATVSVSSASGIASGNVMLSVDGSAATTRPLSSGSAVFSLGLLAPGTHSLSATFPAQGNFFASSATASIFVSQTLTITSANAATFAAGAAGSFTVTATGVPFPSLTAVGTLPTGVTFTDNGNGTATLAGTPPLGTTGTFPLTITASNGVGVPAVQNFTLTVNQPPTITSGTTTTFTEGVSGSFTVTTAGFPIPAIGESPALPAGLTFVDNGDGTASLSGTPAIGTQGSYAIAITAASGALPDASQNFTLNINLGPAITSGSSTTFTEQMAGSFLVTTLAFPAPVLTESGMLPSGVTFTDNHDGTATLAGTPAAGTSATPTYQINISASNGVGTPTVQAFTLTVNATASISSGSTTTFTVGSAGFFSVTTSGSPAPALTFTGTLPAGVMFFDNGNGTAAFSGTPADGTANNYPLIITATNGIGSPAIQNFTLAVNQGAAILTGNATTFTVGVAGSFTVMTSGFPTPSIVEAGTLPGGVTFVDNGDGTGTLSGTPAVTTGGAYPVTFTANNNVDLAAVQTFTLTINQGPAITSSNMASFTEQSSGLFTVTTTGSPVAALSEVGALPAGLSFVDNGDGTASITGIPTAGSSGQYGFTITASNGVLPNATQTFTLSVTGGIAFTSASSAVFDDGTSNSFTVTTSGTPIPTLTESGVLPTGVLFLDNGNGTASLYGNPGTASVGLYTLTIVAHNGVGADATQTFSLQVENLFESAPQITSANHVTFWAKGHNLFTVTTTGVPVPVLTATFISRAITFVDNHDGTATISGAPTGGGILPFTITATGAGGKQFAAVQQFRLQVLQPPIAPRFTSPNQAVFHGGVSNTFTVAAGPVVSFLTLSGALPVGLTYTDNHDGTGTLQGTFPFPVPSSGLAVALTFTASDPLVSVNYHATQKFNLLILP